MISSIFRKLGKYALYLVVLFVIFMISAYGWLATGTKSLPFVERYIHAQLNHLSPNLRFEIGEVEASAGKDIFHTYLNIKEIKVSGQKDDSYLTIKNATFHFNLMGLLPFSKKNFFGIKISLDKVNFDVDETSPYHLPIYQINAFLLNHSDDLKIINFIIRHSEFKVYRDEHPMMIRIKDFSIKPIISDQVAKIDIMAQGEINNNTFAIHSLLENIISEKVLVSGELEHLSYQTLSELGLQSNLLTNAEIKFNMQFNAALTAAGDMEELDLKVTSNHGVINPNTAFKEAIPIDEMMMIGKCKYKCTALDITELKMQLGDSELTASGSIAEGLLNLRVDMEKAPIKNLLKLWPQTFKYQTYEWLFEHIKGGDIGNISAVINYRFNTNKHEQALSLPEARHDFHIWFPLYNASLHNIKNIPQISDIDGVVNIYTDNIDIKVDRAKSLESELKNFMVHISDLAAALTMISIQGEVIGPVQNSLNVALSKQDKKNVDFNNISGEALSNIKIILPISKNGVVDDQVNITIHSTLSNIQGLIANKYPITQGALKLEFTDHKLNINGNAIFDNDMPIKIHHINEDNIDKTKIKFSLSNNDILKLTGYNTSDIISDGKVLATFIIHQENNQSPTMKLKLNLEGNTLNLESIGLQKASNIPANILFNLIQGVEGYEISNYQLTIPGFYSEGRVNINHDEDIITINSHKTSLNGHVFSFIYKNKPQYDYILIQGDEIDFSQANFNKILDSIKSTRKKVLIFESKINSLKLKNNVVINSSILNIKCGPSNCSNMKFFGNFQQNGEVSAILIYPNLDIHSTNAGQMIAALGISKNVNNGIMHFMGHYSSKEVLEGTITIDDYSLYHTPILAKLITLSSLTTASGMLNMLEGKGVFFSSANCSFDYNAGLLTIKKCVQKGPVLNILTQGTVDLKKDYVDLSGTMVPANIINSIIDNIPLIGYPLAGGKDSGIIGTSFTLKGKMDNNGPSVFVNPLSILTPGFLRNIFN